TGTLSLSGSLSLGGGGNNAEISVSSATAVLTFSGGVNLQNGTLTINSLGPVFVPSSIDTVANASSGNVVYNGTATAPLSLTAANNFKGNLTVNSGTVTLGGGGTLAGAS